jgi:hypothetical protein
MAPTLPFRCFATGLLPVVIPNVEVAWGTQATWRHRSLRSEIRTQPPRFQTWKEDDDWD